MTCYVASMSVTYTLLYIFSLTENQFGFFNAIFFFFNQKRQVGMIKGVVADRNTCLNLKCNILSKTKQQCCTCRI